MIEWNFAVVAASVVDAVVVAIAGYWILFRLLLWKVSDAPQHATALMLCVCLCVVCSCDAAAAYC
jgi:NO-binding membrane sensor protein with MHYT domain